MGTPERTRNAFLQNAISGTSLEEALNAATFFLRLITAGLKVDATGKISLTVPPAFDGSLLTNLPSGGNIDASQIISGTIALARLAGITGSQLSASATIARSQLNLGSGLVNADIATGAAIAYAKLALGGSVQASDLAGAITYSLLSLGGNIVNADINSAAAIALTKLAGWPANAAGVLNNNGSGTLSWVSQPATNNAVCQGRLTLTSGLPVTTADVTSATSAYFTPYKGNAIALYDGSSTWNVITFAEQTISLGGLTASTPYDVFAYNNGGTITMETLAWTNATTRATALVLQNGIYVKSGVTTRRYIGTIYINASGGQTDDRVAARYVWNYANRAVRPMFVADTTASWAGSSSWRQGDNNAANQLDFVIGVEEDLVTADLSVAQSDSGGNPNYVSIGLDANSPASQTLLGAGGSPASATYTITASFRGLVAVGRHTLRWLELATGGVSTTWQAVDAVRAGISGLVLA